MTRLLLLALLLASCATERQPSGDCPDGGQDCAVARAGGPYLVEFQPDEVVMFQFPVPQGVSRRDALRSWAASHVGYKPDAEFLVITEGYKEGLTEQQRTTVWKTVWDVPVVDTPCKHTPDCFLIKYVEAAEPPRPETTP